MSKILVCYFSATNTTAQYANKLAKELKADLYEIIPEEEYSKDDLNWQDRKSRSSLEMSNPKTRVKIIKSLNNINEYDKIVLGFPIWWYTAPRIINTFLESYDFNNKSVYIWATSGSSGMGQIVKQLSNTYPSIKLIEGKVVNHIALGDYIKWVESIKKD